MTSCLTLPNQPRSTPTAKDLKALEKAAEAIRLQQSRGEISAQDAARLLSELRRSRSGLIDLLVGT